MNAEPNHHDVPPSRRRPKPTLSCTLCRRRKLKCDRQQPCKTCIDRGLSFSCTFARNVPPPQESRAPNGIHDRITQLEQLVTSLMGSKDREQTSPVFSVASLPDPTSESIKTEIPGTPDRVKISDETTTYTNSGHWTSILDGISELKEHLDQIPTSAHAQDNNVGDIPGPDILFGRQRHATKQELLAALPRRSEADQLVANYFESMMTAPTLLHRPSFLRQYEKFWTHPFEVSTMWLGLLYSVLCIGATFQLSDPESYGTSAPVESLNTARIDFYREKIVQAMILANYTKCPPWTVETMIAYFGTEFTRSSDTQFSSFVLVGMIVRIALRMGYHREPSRFANISPFQAELRRRAWLVIIAIDLVSSAQVGLPRMMQPFMYDTQEPRNLEEEDLHEDLAELPPSKPETMLTPLLYAIITTRVRTVHAKVMDLMNATSQPPYRDFMHVDSLLRHVYDNLPPATQALASEDFDMATDPTSLRRLYIGLSFLKAELMLHRPFHLPGRTDPKYDYSRRVCLNAACEMLDLQHKLDVEIQPGGKLWTPGWQIFTMSWYMSSIVASDFLLATTVLILDLDEDLTAPSPLTYNGSTSGLRLDRGPPSRQHITERLRGAQRIWKKASKRSHEARKAAEAIRLVLSKADASEHGTGEAPKSQIVTSQPDLVSPAPSWDLNDFTDEASSRNVFGMDAMYANPFTVNDMPMDLGPYSDTFNWNAFPSNGQLYPYEQQPQPPFQ
ncbi:hypothetical protein HBI25_050880 [Parastagonospora nodorum]|nr:hypothetical protein HBH52_028070 [Parastagonospora nodorum]KAH3997341.1 hypothetical protein HBI10_140000 [Parastagonospora nodorum]KAH4020886.1 hypothetical protein HBI13_108300 [Parastagonospora nodorum]KAH4053628.1 hypothetical protein HBH49_086240 [Parastagonospora nodorum]KAH4067247.1 hypothetical protein HBH50_137620 [Parastagonospora nodorum]